MEGNMKVIYSLICKNDIHKEVHLSDILKNEKVIKAIKSEFAKGLRNIEVTGTSETTVLISSIKEQFELVVNKSDFADLIELAEEDARKHKRIKKECDGIEIIDFVTLD